MKFWRQILVTASLFTAIISAAILTSCEKNSCDGVTCLNGGSCGSGICTCPAGYEGAQCEFKSVDRFAGIYGGYTTCNNGAPIIDTVTIVPANRGPLTVDVYMESVYPKVLQGYVRNNESTYSVVVTNNDSSKAGSLEYLRVFTITLQADRSLKIHKYERDYTNEIDTFSNTCEFLGVNPKPISF